MELFNRLPGFNPDYRAGVSSRELFTTVLKTYWPLLLVAVLLGLLIPGPSVALGLVAYVLARLHRQSEQWRDFWPFKLFAAGLGLRLTLILLKFAANRFLGTSLSIFGDSSMHINMASTAHGVFSSNIPMTTGLAARLHPGNYGYSISHWFYGSLYYAIGESPFMLHVLNALFCCLAALIIYVITIRICSHKPSARLAMGLVLFMPSQIMWSVEMLKEPAIQVYTAVLIFMFVEVIVSRKWGYLVFLSILWYPLGHLRTFTHLLMLVSLFLAGIFTFPRRLKTSVVILIVLLAAAYLKLGPTGISNYWQSLQERVIVSQMGFVTTGGAWYQFLPDRITPKNRVPLLTPAEFAESYLRAVGDYLLRPFPFKMVSFNKLPALPQMVVWYFLLLICFVPGSLYLLRYHFRSSAIIFAYLLIFTSVQALFTGNEGTAFRQRDTLTIFYFIPIAVGFFNIKGWLAGYFESRRQVQSAGDGRSELSDGIG